MRGMKLFFTHKPLAMQNNRIVAESYQKLIRRDGRIRKAVGITGFFGFFELFPLDVVCTETYQKVLVFDDNRNSLYANYLYYPYYKRFLLSKPAVKSRGRFLLSVC